MPRKNKNPRKGGSGKNPQPQAIKGSKGGGNKDK